MSKNAVFLVTVLLIALYITLMLSEGFTYMAGVWIVGIVATMTLAHKGKTRF